MLTSVLILRQRAYELFLITYVIMTVICVVGYWYHVWIMYENTFGYETWLYATIAVWFLDRLARMGRILKTSLRRAKVMDFNSTIARIDIPGIRWAAPGRCVYVYFPTLCPLEPWENYPFSMIPTSMLNKHSFNDHSGSETSNVEKNQAVMAGSGSIVDAKMYTSSGLTLFVRKRKGMMGSLNSHKDLLTLLDGPYPTNLAKEVLHSDRLLLIGGGIGMTGLLPFLWCRPNLKLLHSIKAADLSFVDSLSSVLDEFREKEIAVGLRLDLDSLLRDEASLGWSKIAVVVCGPAGTCDDVRSIVARLGRENAGKCSFGLEVDAFS